MTTTAARPSKRDNRARLLAKLVREILATPEARDFEKVADVVDALKFRCTRLQIGWTNDAIAEALRIIVSNCPLVGNRAHDRMLRPFHADHQITRADASQMLQRLGVRA